MTVDPTTLKQQPAVKVSALPQIISEKSDRGESSPVVAWFIQFEKMGLPIGSVFQLSADCFE